MDLDPKLVGMNNVIFITFQCIVCDYSNVNGFPNVEVPKINLAAINEILKHSNFYSEAFEHVHFECLEATEDEFNIEFKKLMDLIVHIQKNDKNKRMILFWFFCGHGL